MDDNGNAPPGGVSVSVGVTDGGGGVSVAVGVTGSGVEVCVGEGTTTVNVNVGTGEAVCVKVGTMVRVGEGGI